MPRARFTFISMRFVKIIFFLIAAVIVMVVSGSYWLYNSLNSPVEHDKANQFLTIEKGTSPADIVAKLNTEGVVSSQLPINFYLRFFGDASKLQAGEYQFASPITPLQVLKELETGEERTTKLTIPEGFTRFDIAKRITANFPQDPPMDEKQVLLLMEDTSLTRDIAPNASNLEGYMYPSTYNFPKGAKAADIIKTTVEQFKKIWRPEWSEQARKIGRTPQEIVTIASLIETESKFDAERQKVASVIYNRLSKSIPLGIDQTAVYIAKMQGRWDGTINKSDLEVDSPYNTRRYGGIPPGPISSVTESSIHAALNPAQTDYIFYVLNVQANDGSHNFYASANEFEKGKAEYQRWLEQQRQEKREQANNN